MREHVEIYVQIEDLFLDNTFGNVVNLFLEIFEARKEDCVGDAGASQRDTES